MQKIEKRFDVPDGARECVWQLYLYFIAEGAAFEISLSRDERREIMLQMALPTEHMFDDIYKDLIITIAPHLASFYLSNDHISRLRYMIQSKQEQREEVRCFSKANRCFY